MGDWGANGAKTKITVQDGDSWESLAQRAGLNQRQEEDLMRANPNILQLKAGQTISTGGLKRNDNAYLSNYTAASEGMMTSDQLQGAYAANGTGGYKSPRLQQGTPVPGGNFGYNTTTKGGRSELAWQNNANNPNATAYAPKAPVASTVKPLVGTPQSNIAPVGYGNNAQPAPWIGTAESAVGNPSLNGQAAAQQWMQNQNQNAVNKGYALERGMNPAAGAPSPLPPGTAAQIGPGTVLPNNFDLPKSGYAPNDPYKYGPPTSTQNQQVSPNPNYSQPTPQGAADAANARFNQVATVDAQNTQSIVQQRQQVRFETNDMVSRLNTGNRNLFDPSIDAQHLQAMVAGSGETLAQVQAKLMGPGYNYVPGLNGSLVQPGNMSANGGPDLTAVPSGAGYSAGLPAYTAPVYNTYQDLPTYQGPSQYYNPGYRHMSGGQTSASARRLPYDRQQNDNWRIGG